MKPEGCGEQLQFLFLYIIVGKMEPIWSSACLVCYEEYFAVYPLINFAVFLLIILTLEKCIMFFLVEHLQDEFQLSDQKRKCFLCLAFF